MDNLEQEFKDRFKALHDQRAINGLSVFEIKRRVRREMAYEIIERAETVDELKPALFMIVTMLDQ